MTWPNGSRILTAAAGNPFLPADYNALEDRVIQVAGYRGKSIIATEEARTNVAYGLLTTPDQVSGIVMPTDGLICVAYRANWKNSVASAGRAAVFLGANQLQKTPQTTAAPTVQEASGNGSANVYRPLVSDPRWGLSQSDSSTAYTGDVTTGQLMQGYNFSEGGQAGGAMLIFAAAGTYDVSVQFKSSSGSVTVKERKLWVWTEAFA